VCGAINGNQLARLPKYQFRVTPGDTQDFSWGTLTEQLTYEYIGKRFQDESNLTPLPAYWTWLQASMPGSGKLGGSAARLKPHQRDRADRG